MTQHLDAPYEGATPEQLDNMNVQHFLHLHNYLRNELRMILQFVEELTRGAGEVSAENNRELLEGLFRAGSQYAQHLHAHHHGETQLLFPVLKREGLDSEVVERLNREHDEIGALIDGVTTSLFQMKSADLPGMMQDMHQLGDTLRNHLEYEESYICPLLTHWSSPAKFYAALFQSSR
jgi:hemerythrin-like domain-containing protein